MIEKRMSLPHIITLCLCPHCLAEKCTVSEMGIPANMMVCETQVWIDNEACKKKITKACRYIFKHGASINSVHVKQILQSESLVPTYVCLAKLPLISYLPLPVEHILWPDFWQTIQLLSYVCCQPFTWIWVGCVEGSIHPFNENLVCSRGELLCNN